ncbi:MAG: DUF2970 domain-containing protein [bacterium]
MAENTPEEKSGFLSVMGSVLSAFIGVQSNKNRERDFAKGKMWHFILGGIIATVVFMLTVWFAVTQVMKTVPPT